MDFSIIKKLFGESDNKLLVSLRASALEGDCEKEKGALDHIVSLSRTNCDFFGIFSLYLCFPNHKLEEFQSLFPFRLFAINR